MIIRINDEKHADKQKKHRRIQMWTLSTDSKVQYNVVQHSTVQYNTVQCSQVQHCAVLTVVLICLCMEHEW